MEEKVDRKKGKREKWVRMGGVSGGLGKGGEGGRGGGGGRG